MAAKPRFGIAWYRRFYFCRDKSRLNLCSVETFLDKIKKNVETLLEVIPVLREESRQFFFSWRERSRHYIFFVEHYLDRNILKSDQQQIQILSFSHVFYRVVIEKSMEQKRRKKVLSLM